MGCAGHRLVRTDRRDLIGAWHRPRLRCVRRPAQPSLRLEGDHFMVVMVGIDVHKRTHLRSLLTRWVVRSGSARCGPMMRVIASCCAGRC
jgi:hypothetical protein